MHKPHHHDQVADHAGVHLSVLSDVLFASDVVRVLLLQPEADSVSHKKRERTVIVKELISKRLKQEDLITYKS